jgi:hypothetical protein
LERRVSSYPRSAAFQCCEIDRRPRQPRQLAGVNGNSARCAASVDADALAGERTFEPETDPLRCAGADDDATEADGAAADIAFKPNCLAMQTSIDEHPVRRRVSSHPSLKTN